MTQRRKIDGPAAAAPPVRPGTGEGVSGGDVSPAKAPGLYAGDGGGWRRALLPVAAGLALMLCGCSSTVSTAFIEADGRVSLPWLEPPAALPVVYPGGKAGRQEDDLSAMYGPAWRNLQGEYPEYRFNEQR